MKGFTPRERNGLLTLSTAVLLCLLAGFFMPESCGTSAERDELKSLDSGRVSVYESDIKLSADAEVRQNTAGVEGDSLANTADGSDKSYLRRNFSKSSKGMGSADSNKLPGRKKEKKSSRSTSKPATPQRSLRDERL